MAVRSVAVRRVAVRRVAVRRVAVRRVAVRRVAVRSVAVQSTRPAIGAVGAEDACRILGSGSAVVAKIVTGKIARI